MFYFYFENDNIFIPYFLTGDCRPVFILVSCAIQFV